MTLGGTTAAIGISGAVAGAVTGIAVSKLASRILGPDHGANLTGAACVGVLTIAGIAIAPIIPISLVSDPDSTSESGHRLGDVMTVFAPLYTGIAIVGDLACVTYGALTRPR